MRKHIFLLFSTLLITLCFGASTFAQDTVGEIRGTVKDANGAVIPAAVVTISGINVGFNRTIVSNDEGSFTAFRLPPGTYKVSVADIAGFKGQTKEVRVLIGISTTVEFTLTPTVGAEVTITTDNLIIDTTDTKAQTNITEKEIENLPKGTSFTSLLRTTVSTRGEGLAGGFQVNGASGSENSFVVDGQEVNNFRTGTLNSNNDIPYQSVQEIQVKSSGFEAEFGGATGGVISVVTKSGTNQFRGSFGAQFEPSKLSAGPDPIYSNFLTGAGTTGQYVEVFPRFRDKGTNFFPTASIGGPIVKDKFWFYGIYSPRIFQGTRSTTFFNTVPTSPQGGATGTRTITSVQEATSKQTNEYAFIRLDANPTSRLRLSGSFTWNPIILDGVFLGSNFAIGLPPFGEFPDGIRSGADLVAKQGGRQNSNNSRVEAVWTPTNNWVTTLRYVHGFLNEKLGSYGVPKVPRYRCRQGTGFTPAQVGCPGNFGSSNQTTNNNFQVVKDVSTRDSFDADASFVVGNFGGRHEIKFGYQYNTVSNDVEQGYADTGRIELYYGRTTFPVCFGAFVVPGVSEPIALRPGTIGTGCSLRFGTIGAASNQNQSLYIQDKWQPTPRLTLNLGLRAEKEELPAFNGQKTDLAFNFGEKLAPRLGVSYALTGDGKTKIAAFYGWFYDRLKFELPRGSFGGDFFRVDFFEIPGVGHPLYNGAFPTMRSITMPRIVGNFGDPIGGGCPAGGLMGSYLTRCQLDYRIPSNIPNLVLGSGAPLLAGAVDPDLKPFRQAEFTVEFQREVMRSSVLTARYLYRNVLDAVEDAGFLTPEGSEFYIIANPGKGLHLKRARDLGFERLATAQRRYDAIQIELDSRFVKNLSFNLNYTYSRLYGNYSGLASSDEDGRTSPGVNRFFDLPFLGYAANGALDNGRLATDRPHVFKASGTYTHEWRVNKAISTDFSFFTTAQSGTPITTFVDIYGIPIVKTTRGDLGRTDFFTQTDFSLTQRYKFGRDNKFALAFDINVLNAFNENAVTFIDNDESSAYYLLDFSEVAPTFVQAVNILTTRGVINELNASVAHDPGFNINSTYKAPVAWQTGRAVRFGFRFIF